MLSKQNIQITALTCIIVGTSFQVVSAQSIGDAIAGGKVSGDFNLRFENVSQDNPLADANALTLRSRLTYTSADFNGFSALFEMEESRIVAGMDRFAVPVTGVNTGKYSVIADPETAELDQAYLQYRNGRFKLKAGRQVLTHDGHRFLGHVGWRQDRQSFDGLTVDYATNNSSSFTYSFFNQRNRIFAEEADLASKDHIFKGSFVTRYGKLTGYSYLLEVDNQINNSLDTFGLSLIGDTGGDAAVSYTLEYARQHSESDMNDYDADYLMAEAAISRAGVKYKLTYEAMGSDGGDFGFSTPLATLHKFNGWADTFLRTPNQGLVDIAVTAAGKIGVGKWTVSFHDFKAADATPGVRDFGNELDLQYTRPLGERFLIGLKYARYSAGDSATGKTDTDKLWVWTNFRF